MEKISNFILKVLSHDSKYSMQAYMGGYATSNNIRNLSDWNIHLLKDLA